MNTRARAAAAISLCAAVVISACAATEAAAAKHRIDWVLAHNQLDYLDDAVKEFKASVEKESRGELEINVIRRSQADVAAMVRDGKAQMGHSFADAASSIDPRLLAFDAPFLHRGYGHMEGVIEGPVGRGLLDGLREKGMIGLALTYSGGANGVASAKELRRPEDLRGLKVGVYGHAVDAAWLKALGAVPVAIGHRTEEIAGKARAGELDAVVVTWRNYQREELENVLGRVGLMGVSYLVSVTFVNEKFFAGLPKRHRELLKKAALEVARVERARTIQLNESSRLTSVARGAKETALSAGERAAFVRATAPSYAVIEPVVGSALVRNVRETADGAIPEAAGQLAIAP